MDLQHAWMKDPSIHPSISCIPCSMIFMSSCETNHKVDSWNYNWTFELLRMDYSLSKNTQLIARTNTDVDNEHTALHCLDSALAIDRVWSILLLPHTSRTAATVETMPVAQMEIWITLKKGWFDSKVLVKSTFEAYLSSQQCFLLLILTLQRLFCSFFACFYS